MSTDEIRTTSKTGAQKGSKPERYDLIPVEALRALSVHYGFGETKYPTGEDGIPNYLRGYDWNLSATALQRHFQAFWGGEDLDEESGSRHITAVAWHAFTLFTFMDLYPEYDNRLTTKLNQAKQPSTPSAEGAKWSFDESA